MDYGEYFDRVETTIVDVIRKCYPASWDENHISFSLVDELCAKNRSVSVNGLDRPFRIVWDFRKLRLPEESSYGDIGILVRLTSWAGETVEGVGLLEAKRRDIGKGSFSATKTSQLKRIVKNAPQSQLLLYDYENVSACMDNLSVQFGDHFYRWRYVVAPYTHAVCVPIPVALSLGTYTTDLHKFGVPLSYQLVGRYFRGFDLEMSPNTVSAVKGNVGRYGGCRNLVLVGISTGPAEPELPEVNTEVYSRGRDG